jgi:hypothetical protein
MELSASLLFQKYLFQLDLAAGRIVLSQGSSSYRQSANGVELHRSRRNSHDHGAPRTRRSAIRPRFGAGQRHFASVGRGGKIGIQAASKVVGKVASSQTEFEIKAGDISENLRIGSHTLSHPKVEFADMIREGNLGATIFKQFVVTFDQKNKRVEFVARKL